MAGTGGRQADIRGRDVLIGVVRGARQLEGNLAHRFYHMPERMLSGDPARIRYVALYQSRRLFGADAGIAWYGRVAAVNAVPRAQIGELPRGSYPDEGYLRWEIGQWQRLEHPIRARGVAPGAGARTSLFLLLHSRYPAELLIRTEQEYALYRCLRAAAARTRKNGGAQMLPANPGYTVLVAEGVVGVYTPEGRYEQYAWKEFFYNPHEFLHKLCKYVKIIG